MSKWEFESSCPFEDGLVSICNGQCKNGLPCEYEDENDEQGEVKL